MAEHFDRRKEDALVLELLEMVRKQDERMDQHEAGEFERYDRMIAAAQEALKIAKENKEQLAALEQKLEGPLEAYNTGKSGILVIKTSGNVIKWLAATLAAGGVIWAIVTKKIGG